MYGRNLFYTVGDSNNARSYLTARYMFPSWRCGSTCCFHNMDILERFERREIVLVWSNCHSQLSRSVASEDGARFMVEPRSRLTVDSSHSI